MAAQHVVVDRTDATKYAIKIDDGELFFESTADSDDGEPIVEDKTNSGTYWKIFIDDGELAFESTVTAQDDSIELEDATLSVTWRLEVADSEFRYTQISAAIRKLLSIKSDLGLRVVKSRFIPQNVKVVMTS